MRLVQAILSYKSGQQMMATVTVAKLSSWRRRFSTSWHVCNRGILAGCTRSCTGCLRVHPCVREGAWCGLMNIHQRFATTSAFSVISPPTLISSITYSLTCIPVLYGLKRFQMAIFLLLSLCRGEPDRDVHFPQRCNNQVGHTAVRFCSPE